MMKYLFLTALLLSAGYAYPQDDETMRRLHGTVVKDNLFIRWNEAETAFQYTVDKDGELWRNVSPGMLYSVRNNHGNSAGLHIKFYNPLRYVLKLSMTDVEDPVYKALSQFLSNLPASESAGPSSTEAFLPFQEKAMTKAGVHVKIDQLNRFNGNILLYKWVADFIERVDYTALQAADANQALYNQLVKDINAYSKKADDYLFRKIPIIIQDVNEERGHNDWILYRKQELYNAPSELNSFNKELGTSELVLKALEKSRSEAEEAQKQLEKLLTDDYNGKIQPLLRVSERESFGKYSAAAAVWLGIDFKRHAAPQEAALTVYRQLVTKLKKFTADFAINKMGFRLENIPVFNWKTKTMRNYRYELKKLDQEGNEIEKGQYSCEFTLAKDQLIVPFVSTGAFYTGFRYPNYALEEAEGIKRVAETKPTDVRMRPAVFLNMLFKTRSDWFFPFLQLGLSTGVNDFLVPFGGGLAITHQFSVSGGGMLGWRKDLTALKVGDTVKDDAALKNDLSNRGVVSWYISVNYNFLKK